jgi:hypothetical protein
VYDACVEFPMHLIKFGGKGKFLLMLYSSQRRVDIRRITIVVSYIRIPGARFNIQIYDSAILSPDQTA